jgi:hypothetical protein
MCTLLLASYKAFTKAQSLYKTETYLLNELADLPLLEQNQENIYKRSDSRDASRDTKLLRNLKK